MYICKKQIVSQPPVSSFFHCYLTNLFLLITVSTAMLLHLLQVFLTPFFSHVFGSMENIIPSAFASQIFPFQMKRQEADNTIFFLSNRLFRLQIFSDNTHV